MLSLNPGLLKRPWKERVLCNTKGMVRTFILEISYWAFIWLIAVDLVEQVNSVKKYS
jgi:hypothetical protein